VLSQKVDADGFSVEVSYGPDGDAAEAIYYDGLDDVTGVIAKGLPQLGSVPLPRIDAGMLNGLYAALLADGKKSHGGAGLSPRSVHYVHTILHRAFRDAVRLGTDSA
jgi:hypothetical protein